LVLKAILTGMSGTRRVRMHYHRSGFGSYRNGFLSTLVVFGEAESI
jgi:hypothetical protein